MFIRCCALLFVLCVLFSGCSVGFAAGKNGVRPKEMNSCVTRYDFLKLQPYVLSSETLEDGGRVEVYQYRVDHSSKLRALCHGVLDFWSCGLWEIAGCNIEEYIHDREWNKFFQVRVYFDQFDQATNVEFLGKT